MDKDYQRHKNNKYFLPNAVYHMTIWLIRDYDRMQQRLDEILLESSSSDDGIHSGNQGSEVLAKVMKREEYRRKTLAIEEALKMIPEEYQRGVWNSVCHREPYPQDADRNTYGRWKSRFIYNVALKMNFITREEVECGTGRKKH